MMEHVERLPHDTYSIFLKTPATWLNNRNKNNCHKSLDVPYELEHSEESREQRKGISGKF